MVKTTFIQRSQKCVKYFDFGYHLHKSTFKGLGLMFKQYNDIEKQYSSQLIRLTQNISSHIEDINKEMPTVQTLIRQFVNFIQVKSQLHFNYSERIRQISSYYTTEYQSSKKLKQRIMGLIKDKNLQQHERIKEKRDRQALNNKQKQICQSYYDNLQKYYDEEGQRTRKLKQQLIIYFSITKKMNQKQQEVTKGFSDKLNRQQLDIACPEIEQIEKMIVDQHNGYGQDQLKPRKFANNQLFQDIKRASIRQSMIIHDKGIKVEDLTNQLRKTIEDYRNMAENLCFAKEPSKLYGLFDSLNIHNKGAYARYVQSQQLKLIFYQMMHRYWLQVGGTTSKLNIQIIKANLKILDCKPTKPALTIKEFVQSVQSQQRNSVWKWHLNFLLYLNSVFQDGNFTYLDAFLKKQKDIYIGPTPETFSLQISVVAMDILLQAVITLNQENVVLYDNFLEILPNIYEFGEKFLNINKKTTILLLLRKLNRMLKVSQECRVQQLQEMINLNYHSTSIITEKQRLIQLSLTNQLYNSISQNILQFFSSKYQLINTIKIALILQKVGNFQNKQFSAMQHIHRALKAAGFTYLQKADQDASLQGSVFRGHQRLKNIVQILDELQYDKINSLYFEPTAGQLAKILGVGRHALEMKMFEQFIEACMEIIQANIQLILQEGGVDKEGYILRLGCFLAKIDKKNPKPLTYYNKYLQSLELYLAGTQKEYNLLLQKARQTQLWIVQDNSQATQNCMDFCSLLNKPFQFLLTSLKELEDTHPTQFQKKYSDFIRLRLNTILKQQILRYIQFLYGSLNSLDCKEPELVLKPKRYEKVQKRTVQGLQKHKYSFKQITRRLYNMLFLKDQMQQMICDFLDKDIYELLDHSIFNIQKVKRVASQSSGQTRQILINIQSIVSSVLDMQSKLISKVADVTIFYFWKPIFINLYFQEERGAITQFFSTKEDYRVSTFTFVSIQSHIQQELTLIGKNIPEEFLDLYSTRFCESLFKATRSQILNSTKFKIPLNQNQIVRYLEADQAHLLSLMKRRFFNQNIIQEKLRIPIKKLLEDFVSPTNRLTQMFQQATLKNDKQICIYVLAILNLRPNQERAQQFIKKYKNTVFHK